MARKKLTRFVIQCDGRDGQVLKVHDKGTELFLFLPHAEYYRDEPFVDVKIKEQRFSVHATENSTRNINVIKQTIRLESGDIIETVLEAKGPKAGMFQMLFCRASPDLGDERYAAPVEGSGAAISLGNYDPTKRTFIYSIFITSLDGPKKFPGSSRYRHVSHDLLNFRLFVVYSFIPLPSHWYGQLIHNLSNAPRINKAEVAGKIAPHAEGFSPDVAKQVVVSRFLELCRIVTGWAEGMLPPYAIYLVSALKFGVWSDVEFGKAIVKVDRKLKLKTKRAAGN